MPASVSRTTASSSHAPAITVAPYLVVVVTDARYYAELSDDVYRFLPVRLGPDDLADRQRDEGEVVADHLEPRARIRDHHREDGGEDDHHQQRLEQRRERLDRRLDDRIDRRPVLVEQCYKCHSAQSEKLKGGLRVDSRAALLAR